MPLQEKPYSSPSYSTPLWYKKGSVGIRRRKGDKKQIWSFGSKSGLGRPELMELGVQCLRKLDAGAKEDDVYEWVVAQCKK
jgi:hypothetical protein